MHGQYTERVNKADVNAEDSYMVEKFKLYVVWTSVKHSVKGKDVIILWDMPIHTDKIITNKLDIVIKDIWANVVISQTEKQKKKSEYKDLELEITKMWANFYCCHFQSPRPYQNTNEWLFINNSWKKSSEKFRRQFY